MDQADDRIGDHVLALIGSSSWWRVWGATPSDAPPSIGTTMTPDDGTIESAIANARTDISSVYAGATYRRADGTYLVYGLANSLDELEAYFRASVDVDLIDAIEFVGVRRSLDELHAIQQEIRHGTPWFEANRIELAGAAIRQQVGLIEISLYHYTPEAERSILEHFGADRVRVDPVDAGLFFE